MSTGEFAAAFQKIKRSDLLDCAERQFRKLLALIQTKDPRIEKEGLEIQNAWGDCVHYYGALMREIAHKLPRALLTTEECVEVDGYLEEIRKELRIKKEVVYKKTAARTQELTYPMPMVPTFQSPSEELFPIEDLFPDIHASLESEGSFGLR